jgi:FkbM family methyltransferase
MKHLIKRAANLLGGHVYSDASLPTGVHWLRDIDRSGLLGRSPTYFDVGANVGQTVQEIRRVQSDAIIHAFEPFAAPYAALAEMARGLPDVTANHMAMGAQVGSVCVRPQALSVLNSLVENASCESTFEPETVQVETVDRYCSQRALETIDVLKTDTEGFDLEVLRGAGKMLSEQRIGFVYSEVTFQDGNRQNTPFQPVFDWLSEHGYCFLGLYETYSLHHFEEPNLFCNALFVSRRARQRSLRACAVSSGGLEP